MKLMFKHIKDLFRIATERKPKPILLDNTYKLVPAFQLEGETYYMHEEPLNTATGRGLEAMVCLEELIMRCDINYLNNHTKAIDKILTDSEAINVADLAVLNYQLKERIGFLVALPEHVYKMASIVFFTKDESPYKYDHTANQKKIAKWKQADGMYDFFLQTPLSTLVPYLQPPGVLSPNYQITLDRINTAHLDSLQAILSKPTS
jgi:hypothetical protein